MGEETQGTWLGSLPVVLSAVMPSFSGRNRVLGRSAGSKGAVYGSCTCGQGALQFFWSAASFAGPSFKSPGPLGIHSVHMYHTTFCDI